ncbi:hypothetical protein PHMEG_00011454 [Phytophthora megakarya]|uniref:Uncharacterized protein n=1 Tax=Phytophthora megakarya TaxID=4795 RepID=A0A225WB74_9STRA|nr:hypothetical protein PHMEG_00011454 [Phytophthora megakarya]
MQRKIEQGNSHAGRSEGMMVQNGNKLENKFDTKILLDCRTITVYVLRGFAKKCRLKTHTDRTINLKLGEDIIAKPKLMLVTIEILLQRILCYRRVAVVFDIPDEFGCVHGIPFFVESTMGF